MNRAWVLWVGLAAGLTGCVGSKGDKVQGRSQIGEDPAGDPDAFATLGHKTSVGNTDPIPVSGVGLVYGLKGTGSSPPPGQWRSMLEQGLRRQGFSNIKDLLDDPNKTTSLVIVSALIPAGARKDEPRPAPAATCCSAARGRPPRARSSPARSPRTSPRPRTTPGPTPTPPRRSCGSAGCGAAAGSPRPARTTS